MIQLRTKIMQYGAMRCAMTKCNLIW